MHKRQQHELHGFSSESESLHPLQQCIFVLPCGLTRGGNVIQLNPLILNPLTVRTLSGKIRLNLVIRHDTTLLKIHEEQTTRLQTTLGAHIGWMYRDCAHLTRHNYTIIVRLIITTRTQTISIKNCPD